MINDPALLPKLPGHVMIPIATKLLLQCFFNGIYNYRIFKDLPLLISTMGAGFYSFMATGFLIIKAAALNGTPLQYLAYRKASLHILPYKPFNLRS